MIKQVLSLVAIVLLAALIFAPMLINTPLHTSLTPLANYYATQGADDLGAPNLVTAIVVTYRGLDTLGEVTVLFIATAGIGFLMGKRKNSSPLSVLLRNYCKTAHPSCFPSSSSLGCTSLCMVTSHREADFRAAWLSLQASCS